MPAAHENPGSAETVDTASGYNTEVWKWEGGGGGDSCMVGSRSCSRCTRWSPTATPPPPLLSPFSSESTRCDSARFGGRFDISTFAAGAALDVCKSADADGVTAEPVPLAALHAIPASPASAALIELTALQS
jgi:hypothetical protein